MAKQYDFKISGNSHGGGMFTNRLLKYADSKGSKNICVLVEYGSRQKEIINTIHDALDLLERVTGTNFNVEILQEEFDGTAETTEQTTNPLSKKSNKKRLSLSDVL